MARVGSNGACRRNMVLIAFLLTLCSLVRGVASQDISDPIGLSTQGSGDEINFVVYDFNESPSNITVPPLSHKVPANSRVTFYCEASGTPAPEVFWRKNNRTLNERRNRYIKTDRYWSALTLESVGSKQSGVYQCVANNSVGAPSVANASLFVYDSGQALPQGFPVVTDVTNRSITVIEKGFPMRLQCAIVGNPMPEVIWYRNKKPVDRGSDRTFEVVSRPGVPGSHDLSIMESETEDHGDYVCMGRNTHGTVYSMVMKVYVKVRRYAPAFTIRPDAVYNVMAGGSLNLTCVAVGSPMPYVKWSAENERLGNPARHPIGRNVLELKNIQRSKNYTCTAQSGLGTIMVTSQVRVQALPDAPDDVWVTDVTPISAKVSWIKSVQQKGPISTDEPEYVVQFRVYDSEQPMQWSEQGEDDIGRSLTYILSGLTPYTKYELRVVPFILYGYGTPSIIRQFLTAEAAPASPPYNVKAKAVSQTTALIQWKPPQEPNGEIENYRILYCLARDSAQPKNRWMMEETSNSNELHVLNGLIHRETYSVSVEAVNRVGTGPASPSIEFTMIQGAPMAPGNLQAIAKTARTITLKWEKPQGSNQGILSYEIYINNSRTRQPLVKSVVPPQEEHVLEDLFPNTVYNIRITARSEHGEGPHTGTIQVTTEEAEPSSPPLNIRASAPTHDAGTKLRVEWEAPSAAQANGEITGYKLFYKLASSFGDDVVRQLEISDPDQTQEVIEGLQVWTEYEIWMKASTSAGDSPSSEPIVGRTGEAVPNAPRLFSVLAINSSAVLLTWRRLSERDARGVIRGYYFHQSEIGPGGNRIGEPKVIILLNGSATNHTITGLKARQKYVFQIQAFSRAGDGLSSKPKTVETLGAVPTAPQNLSLEIVDQDPPRVRVTWSAPREVHGGIISYRLMWGKRTDNVLRNTAAINANRYSYIANKMMKGTEYEFRLQAQNEENYGVAAVDHVRTEDGVPSGSPQRITAEYESDSSAKVSWQELDPGLRNGIIIMYQVRYQDQANSIDLRAVNTSETSVVLTDLTPGAKYFIQVVAFTSAGAGPTSHRVVHNTIQSRPPAPTNVRGERINPTSIKVTWRPPMVTVSGYNILYSTQDLGTDENWQKEVTHQPNNVFILTDLDAHRAYAIKVQALSPTGEPGLESEEDFVNKVMIPPKSDNSVTDLTSSKVTSTSVWLVWQPPVNPDVNNYEITYTGYSKQEPGVTHDGSATSVSSDVLEKIIVGLKPDYDYSFSVNAKYDDPGLSEDSTAVYTVATNAIASPKLKRNKGSAVIALSREENKFDELYIIVTLSSETRLPSQIPLAELETERRRRAVDTQPQVPYIAGKFVGPITLNEFTVGDDNEYGTYTNRKLEDGVKYKAFVRVLIEGEEFSSPYSSNFTADGPVVVVNEPVVSPVPQQDNMVALILGPTGGVFVIILIIIIIVVVIRRNKTHKKEKAPEPTKVIMDQPPVYPNDPVELRRMQFSTPGMQSHPPIPILQLSAHIEQLRDNDNLKFSQEYESIEPGQQFTWDNSNLEYNKPKNRYANVIAYDHSRVVLPSINGIPGADYINANYIDGYRKQNAYISTQGPLSETFGDFWRMVWEQRSATIVMMTKLEERARVKCDTYWPCEGSEMYGPIIVTLTDCMELATYTVRTFQIEKENYGEKREVRQFQFTAWPDHGVPDYPTPLLIFMRRVKAATPSDSGPMIVHCSAGVGRTGAFIVIDAMLERIKHEKTVDIYGHVTCLRAQRNYMVQTEDQYIFIHDALLEAVLSGNTEIPARNLYSHIQKLTQRDGAVTGMEMEFKTLSNTKTNQARIVTANLAVNKFKNRIVNVLPFESNRVCLLPIRGVDGSDYINASFVDGYRFKKAYIATQGPLAETTEDFWRMLWEHNCTIVVMLTKTREMGREKSHQYWPESRSARYQYFVVDPHAEYNMPEYTLREFKVTDARDGQSRTVRLFQFNEWPEQGIPSSGMSFIQFIGQVHKTKEQFGQEGPITVHCTAGIARTGVFITLSIILERMRYEGVVDMFQTVKMLRTQRQGMVNTEEQYGFCYQAALEHLASFDHY